MVDKLSLKENFKLKLYDALFEILRNYPINDLKTKITNFLDNIFKSENDEKLNLVLLGTVSAGKTRIANSLLEYFSEEYKNLLKECVAENTLFYLIIERSENDQISLTKGVLTSHFQTVKELKVELLKLDREGAEIREKIKKSELEGIDIDEFEAQCIVIKLPKIPPSIRIVDTPGPSLKHFQVKIADFLKNSFMNILLYIVTTDNKSSLDLGEGRLLKSINKNNVHQFVYPIINKIDCLDKDLKQVNCFEKSESEKEIDYQDIVIHHQNQLNNLKSCLKNFQVLNLNILDNDTNKNNIKLIFEEILEYFNLKKSIIFKNSFITSLKNGLDSINDEISKDTMFDKTTVDKILTQVRKSKQNLKDNLREYFEKILGIKNSEDFRNKYFDINCLLKEEFDKRNKKLNGTYMVKASYIKDQLEHLNEIFQKSMNKKIENIIQNEIDAIYNVLSDKEKEILKSLMKERYGEEFSDNMLFPGLMLLGTVLTSTAGFVGRAIVISLASAGSEAAAAVAIPVVGIVIGVGLGLWGFKDFLSFWGRDGCFKDCIEHMLKQYKDILKNTFDNTNKEFEEITDKIISYLQTKKKGCELIDKLKASINSLENTKDKDIKSIDVILREQLTNEKIYSKETSHLAAFYKKLNL